MSSQKINEVYLICSSTKIIFLKILISRILLLVNKQNHSDTESKKPLKASSTSESKD